MSDDKRYTDSELEQLEDRLRLVGHPRRYTTVENNPDGEQIFRLLTARPLFRELEAELEQAEEVTHSGNYWDGYRAGIEIARGNARRIGRMPEPGGEG